MVSFSYLVDGWTAVNEYRHSHYRLLWIESFNMFSVFLFHVFDLDINLFLKILTYKLINMKDFFLKAAYNIVSLAKI